MKRAGGQCLQPLAPPKADFFSSLLEQKLVDESFLGAIALSVSFLGASALQIEICHRLIYQIV